MRSLVFVAALLTATLSCEKDTALAIKSTLSSDNTTSQKRDCEEIWQIEVPGEIVATDRCTGDTRPRVDADALPSTPVPKPPRKLSIALDAVSACNATYRQLAAGRELAITYAGNPADAAAMNCLLEWQPSLIWLTTGDWSAVPQEVMSKMKSIEGIVASSQQDLLHAPPNIYNLFVTNPQALTLAMPIDLSVLSRFSGLERLTLEGHFSGFPTLRQLTELTHLTVTSSNMPATAVVAIGKLTELRRLDLWSTAVTDEHLEDLTNLRHLRELDIGATNITSDGAAKLAKMSWLRELSIAATALDDAAAQNLFRALPELERLSLWQASVGPKALKSLASHEHLTDLSAPGDHVTDSDCRYLAAHQDLKRLNIAFSQLGDECLRHLPKMPALLVLDASFTKVGTAGIRHVLAQAPMLQHAHLNFTKADMAQVDKRTLRASVIEHLQLAGSTISANAVEHINVMKRLDHLEIIAPEVTADMVQPLLALASPAQLSLSGISATEEASALLDELKTHLSTRNIYVRVDIGL